MRKFMVTMVIASLLTPSQLPASSKPCRDKDGRIIACPKVRKASPRCKDAQGRFVSCTPAKANDPRQP